MARRRQKEQMRKEETERERARDREKDEIFLATGILATPAGPCLLVVSAA